MFSAAVLEVCFDSFYTLLCECCALLVQILCNVYKEVDVCWNVIIYPKNSEELEEAT